MSTVGFFVPGIPVAKGSLKAFIPRGWQRPVLTSTGGKPLNVWEQKIAVYTRQHGLTMAPRGVPVSLCLDFKLPRPKSLPKSVTAHTKKPDLDKLCRGVLDGLTGVAYVDDSQVEKLTASKAYAPEGYTGVYVVVNSGDT